jgi:O-antigen/teichoic acid export membrane protein
MSSRAEVKSVLHFSESLSADTLASSAAPSCVQSAPALGTLATRGGVYLTARYGLSILVSIGNMFLLTRWIGPHAYGLFVTSVGLTTFLASLTRFGIDTYLVRCEPPPSRAQYNVAFTLILINAFVLVVVGVACVPLLKSWYRNDEFAAPYLALLMTVPLTGAAGLPMAKLERALNFHAVAGIELGGQVLAFLVAAMLAWRGSGVWAPVGGLFCWQVFALVAGCAAARFSPGLALHAQESRRILTFGFGFAASMRVWQLRSLVNPILVGRFAGAEGVALVALALRVAEGIGFLRTAAGRLAIAALARLQSDRECIKKALEQALQLQVLVLGPLLCVFALCGPWIVPRILGARWSGVSIVYPFVAIGVLLSSVFNLQASALFVVGERWAVLKAFSCHVGCLSLATYLLVPRVGLVGYGWSELLACAGYGFIHSAIGKVAPISYRRVTPWLGLFIVILGMAAGWKALAGIAGTVLILFALLTAAQVISGAPNSLRAMSTKHLNAFTLRHARTFFAKAKLRGWSYLTGLIRFQLTAHVYLARNALKRAMAFLQTCRWRERISPPSVVTGNVISMMAGKNGRFHFLPTDIPAIVQGIPAHLRRRTVEEANRFLAHRFLFRNREEAFHDRVDWNFCPQGNLSWQWDLNRHRFFLTLGTAHYYSGDAQYMGHMLDLWRDWIESNPVGNGNWKYPFEVAARLQNWLWCYFLLVYSSVSRPPELAQLESALLEHARFVSDHLEYHWPNNHLLLEAKALYAFALLFPQLDAKRRFMKRARGVLCSEASKQILPDGCHAELSSMYHRIVAGELQELVLLADRLGAPLPEQISEKIRSMTSFSRAMLRPDGSVPLFGDSAENDTYLRFDSAHQDYSDLNYWLWPHLSDSECESPDDPATTTLEVFPDAGYAFLRNPERQNYVTFDCGQFSRCQTPNHGHSDALSFELWTKGHAVLVDPGVYFPWNDDTGWTAHFRSTSAHNTVEIDSKSQSEICVVCDVRRRAKCRILRQAVGGDFATVAAECVPYWSNGDRVRHTREICLHEAGLKIHDRIDGTGVHSLAWSFQFVPELDVMHHHDSLLGNISGERLFSLKNPMPQQLRLELFHGHKHPLRGWASRNSSRAIPATLARFSVQTQLPFETEFTFIL